MFGFNRRRNSYHYGSDTYKYINSMIKSSKRMQIVSPYIDSYYANIILRSSPKTEFYIISSSLDASAKKILGKRYSKRILLTFALLSVLLLWAEITLGIGNYLLALSLVPFLFGISKYTSSSTGSKRIHLKTPKKFVHAKMYISDSQAILGSVNLTYKGTHSNIEHIDITSDTDELYKLREQFWDIWGTY